MLSLNPILKLTTAQWVKIQNKVHFSNVGKVFTIVKFQYFLVIPNKLFTNLCLSTI